MGRNLDPKTPLAKRIIEVRDDYTRVEFAEMVGVTERAWSSYERGEAEPNLSIYTKIVEITDVNLHWLLTGEGEMYGQSGEVEYERLKPYKAGPWFVAHLGILLTPTTYEDFSKKSGISVIKLREIMNGRVPNANEVNKICEAGGVRVEWFMTGKEPVLQKDAPGTIEDFRKLHILRTDILEDFIKNLLELSEEGPPIPPEHMARIITMQYESFVHTNPSVEHDYGDINKILLGKVKS